MREEDPGVPDRFRSSRRRVSPEFQHRIWLPVSRSRAGLSIMKIYVGNLSFSTTEQALRAAFEAHGEVASASIVTDRDTGRPRGFGFIEMTNDDQARAA